MTTHSIKTLYTPRAQLTALPWGTEVCVNLEALLYVLLAILSKIVMFKI